MCKGSAEGPTGSPVLLAAGGFILPPHVISFSIKRHPDPIKLGSCMNFPSPKNAQEGSTCPTCRAKATKAHLQHAILPGFEKGQNLERERSAYVGQKKKKEKGRKRPTGKISAACPGSLNGRCLSLCLEGRPRDQQWTNRVGSELKFCRYKNLDFYFIDIDILCIHIISYKFINYHI